MRSLMTQKRQCCERFAASQHARATRTNGQRYTHELIVGITLPEDHADMYILRV